jgi:hypothetical protein
MLITIYQSLFSSCKEPQLEELHPTWGDTAGYISDRPCQFFAVVYVGI